MGKPTFAASRLMNARMAHLLPLPGVDVEALAQRVAHYMQIVAGDTEILSRDPTRRDELYAQFNTRPDVKPGPFAPETLVPFGEDPDVYLNHADEELRWSRQSQMADSEDL